MTRPRTSLLAALLIGLLAPALSACDLSPLGIGEPPIKEKVLTTAELQSAMLRPRDIGPEFVVSRKNIRDTSDLGCLPDPAHLKTRVGATAAIAEQSRISFAPRSAEDGTPPVLGQEVWSMRSTAAATKAMTAISAILTSCPRVVVGEGGDQVRLRVATSSAPATPEVDEQLNVAAVGTLALPEKHAVKLGFWIALARVKNQIVFLHVLDFGTAGTITPLTDAALTRLTPVLRGLEPAIPAPLGLTARTPASLMRDVTG